MPPRRVASHSKPPVAITADPSPSPSTSSSVPQTLAQLKAKAKDAAVNESSGFVGSVQTLWKSYQEQTSSRLKLIDSFMLFLMLTGVAQFLYCVLVTNFPFNAFIGGFAATVGQFVLCGSLRIQVNPENKETFPTISPERAFGDFLAGSLVLHFFVWNYLG